MEILTTLAPYLLPMVVAIAVILLTAGVKKLLDKWDIDRSERIDDMIDKYVGIGVNYAEVYARKWLAENGNKLSQRSKKAKAIDTVMGELKQSGVLDVTKDLVERRIESWLEVDGFEPGTPSDPQKEESA